jgi:succinoglycan biosynthesis transport protein ExoP
MDDYEARADVSEASDTPATLQYYTRLVVRRWWLPLSFVVLGVSLALVYTGLQNTAYAARSTILLSPLDPGTADELPRLAPTVARVVRSDAVLLQARDSYAAGRPAARGAAITLDELRSRTTVRVPRDTSLFEVTARGRTQQDANRLVRAVVGAATRQLARLGGAQRTGPGQAAQLRVAVLGPPISEGKVSPTPTRNLLLGLNLGILLGIAAALLVRDPQRARVRADVLTRYLETPNLIYAPLPRTGAVGHLSRVASPSAGRTLHVGSDGRQAEGIRLLGGRLSQWFEEDRRTVLLLGDLSPHTLRSVALRLAGHLARIGLDPVVIEADFHGGGWSPGAEQARGLGEVLEDGDGEPDAMVVETSTNGAGPSPVTIVPRGTTHAEPAVLFASDAFSSLLEGFAARDHVVLVVGPPTEFQAEVLALADVADGVVLLVPPWITHARAVSLTSLRNVADETSVLVSVFGEPDAIPLPARVERTSRVYDR